MPKITTSLARLAQLFLGQPIAPKAEFFEITCHFDKFAAKKRDLRLDEQQGGHVIGVANIAIFVASHSVAVCSMRPEIANAIQIHRNRKSETSCRHYGPES